MGCDWFWCWKKDTRDADHTVEDLKVLVVKGNLKTTQENKTFELRIIIIFDTKVNGLNVDLSFLNHYSTFLQVL